MTVPPVDPTRCPLCGGDNTCGMARGKGTCWCFSARVPADVLERVPPELRDQACVCERCASGVPDASTKPDTGVAGAMPVSDDRRTRPT